jgi:hypothetical protein
MLAGAAFALTSAGTGYYILKNHPEHFKRTVFDVSFTAYNTIKSTSSTLYNSLSNLSTMIYGASPPQPEEPKIKITDVKLINSDMIIDLPVTLFQMESTLKPGMLLHVSYIYNQTSYRIVFNYGQDTSILSTNTQWLEEGFRNGIDIVESTTSLENDELWSLMHQYAGPLSDFYNEARHIQNYKGFLNTNMTSKIIEDPAKDHIKITNILGETKTFPTELKPQIRNPLSSTYEISPTPTATPTPTAIPTATTKSYEETNERSNEGIEGEIQLEEDSVPKFF